MNEADYISCVFPFSLCSGTDAGHRVRDTLRLARYNGQRQGTLFPMPITLDVSSQDIQVLGLAPGVKIALRDPRDEAALAILTSMSLRLCTRLLSGD